MADYSAHMQAEGAGDWDNKQEAFKGAVETDMTNAEDNIVALESSKAPVATKTEVDKARGSCGELDTRLDVSINEDGSLKQTISPATWIDIPVTFTRTDDNTFNIIGTDYTSIMIFGRAIRLTISGSYVYANVKTSTFSGGNTIVDVLTDIVASAPSACAYASDIPDSTSYLKADIAQELGVTVTYTNSLPTQYLFTSGHKITCTYTASGLLDVEKHYLQDGTTFSHKFTHVYDPKGLCTSITRSEVE
jgi:hypothetical protein